MDPNLSTLFGISKGQGQSNRIRLPNCPFPVYKFDTLEGLEIVATLGGDFVSFSYKGDAEHPIALMAREILWSRTIELEVIVVDNRSLKTEEKK